MATCPTCGHARSSIPSVVKWLIGLAVVGFVGLPVFVVVCLAAIAAIGASVPTDETNGQAVLAAEATLQEQIESGMFVSEELRDDR